MGLPRHRRWGAGLWCAGGMLLGTTYWTEDAAAGPRPYEIGRNEIKSIRCLTICLHWEGDPTEKA